jgi:predicted dehydrogenase
VTADAHQGARPLRWGVLGTGLIAEKVVPLIEASRGSTVVAVGSRSVDRATDFARRLDRDDLFTTGYDGVLEREDVDAVYVTLPNHLHVPWSVRAMDAGKHVLCEKPLSATRAGAERVGAASRQNERVADEGFMYRWHPHMVQLMKLAHDAESVIGPLKRVRCAFSVVQKDERILATRLSHAMHGGALMDLGCYCVSLLEAIDQQTPSIEHVEARLADPQPGETHGVNVDMKWSGRLGSGVPFAAECSIVDFRGVHVTLEGEWATARTGWPWAPPADRVEIALTTPDGEELDPLVTEDGGDKFTLQFEAFESLVELGADDAGLDAAVRRAGVIETLLERAGVERFPEHSATV